MNRFTNIIITARRNRDEHGNTYHTVDINRVGSRLSYKSDVTYGYGSHWEKTALEIMAGLWGGSPDRGMWHWQRETGYTVDSTVLDVKRARDL
jgi:hypothetical protein